MSTTAAAVSDEYTTLSLTLFEDFVRLLLDRVHGKLDNVKCVK